MYPFDGVLLSLDRKCEVDYSIFIGDVLVQGHEWSLLSDEGHPLLLFLRDILSILRLVGV